MLRYVFRSALFLLNYFQLVFLPGVYHEQSRPDRDDYVTVLWDNILDDKKDQFTKEKEGGLHDTVDYNIYSVMHYSNKQFSKNGNPTLEAKDGSPLYEDEKITRPDMLKLVAMYRALNKDCSGEYPKLVFMTQ